MRPKTPSQVALTIWHHVVSESVRREQPDLSARQLALMLTVYLEPPPHTVRGLSARLNVSKPAIVRALDSLGKLDFVRRRRDADDRRNVLIQRTVTGSDYLSALADLIISALRSQ